MEEVSKGKKIISMSIVYTHTKTESTSLTKILEVDSYTNSNIQQEKKNLTSSQCNLLFKVW